MNDDEKLIEAAREVLGEELVPRPSPLEEARADRKRADRLILSGDPAAAARGARLLEDADRRVDAAFAERRKPRRPPDWAEALGLSLEEAEELAAAPEKWSCDPIKVAR